MATRAAVIYGTENESHGFYVHSDGYPECVGHALRDFYNSKEAALALSGFSFCEGVSFLPQPEMLKNKQQDDGWFRKCFDKEEAMFDVLYDDAEPTEEAQFSGDIVSIFKEADDSALEYLYWWKSDDETPKWRFVKIYDVEDTENINFESLESDSVPYDSLVEDIQDILANWHNDKNFEAFMYNSSIFST